MLFIYVYTTTLFAQKGNFLKKALLSTHLNILDLVISGQYAKLIYISLI